MQKNFIFDYNHINFFNSYFDCIYGLYINNHEKKKLEYLINKYNIKINLFKGIDGNTKLSEYNDYLKVGFINDWEIKNKKKRLSIGAFGHIHSFINIINDAKNKIYKKILILEADVYIGYNLFPSFADFFTVINDYKILYLGAGKWNDNIIYKDKYYLPNETTGTFAISFDYKIFDELIELWTKFVNPTDVCLWDLTNKYKNECFVIYPNLIICDLSNSNIQEKSNRTNLYVKFNWNLFNYDVTNQS